MQWMLKLWSSKGQLRSTEVDDRKFYRSRDLMGHVLVLTLNWILPTINYSCTLIKKISTLSLSLPFQVETLNISASFEEVLTSRAFHLQISQKFKTLKSSVDDSRRTINQICNFNRPKLQVLWQRKRQILKRQKLVKSLKSRVINSSGTLFKSLIRPLNV